MKKLFVSLERGVFKCVFRSYQHVRNTKYQLKYLILIFTSSLFMSTTSAMTLEKFHGWNIQLLEEEMIAIERSGDIEDSENIIFVVACPSTTSPFKIVLTLLLKTDIL